MITRRTRRAVNGRRRVTEPARAGHATRVAVGDALKVNLILSSERTAPDTRLGIVIVTRNRLSSLVKMLEHPAALEEKYPTIVVNNASEDNTVRTVRDRFPEVKLVALDQNYGAVARNFGIEIADQVRPGLQFEPPWEIADHHMIEAGTTVKESITAACTNCGQVSEFAQGSKVTPCPRCHKTVWSAVE